MLTASETREGILLKILPPVAKFNPTTNTIMHPTHIETGFQLLNTIFLKIIKAKIIEKATPSNPARDVEPNRSQKAHAIVISITIFKNTSSSKNKEPINIGNTIAAKLPT